MSNKCGVNRNQEMTIETPKSMGRVMGIEDNGDIIHVEFETENGETVAGIYELIGWTEAPKAVKMAVEQELWVPKKLN
jgi:hypothetical protein